MCVCVQTLLLFIVLDFGIFIYYYYYYYSIGKKYLGMFWCDGTFIGHIYIHQVVDTKKERKYIVDLDYTRLLEYLVVLDIGPLH